MRESITEFVGERGGLFSWRPLKGQENIFQRDFTTLVVPDRK